MNEQLILEALEGLKEEISKKNNSVSSEIIVGVGTFLIGTIIIGLFLFYQSSVDNDNRHDNEFNSIKKSLLETTREVNHNFKALNKDELLLFDVSKKWETVNKAY